MICIFLTNTGVSERIDIQETSELLATAVFQRGMFYSFSKLKFKKSLNRAESASKLEGKSTDR